MEIEFEKQKSQIKALLATYLGIEPSDIDDNDTLVNELHMGPTDFTDFGGILEENGFDLTKVDYEEIETFIEYVESIVGI